MSVDRQRGFTPDDLDRIERAVLEILDAVGEDSTRAGLRETPSRVARAFAELLRGYGEDPAAHLDRQFEAGHDEMVVVRNIPFASLCEHHILPFIGSAAVAYIPGPDGKVCGLSKLARLVEGYSRRLQVQERLTSQIADAIQTRLNARGAMVILSAEHLCMTVRGVRKPGAITTTSALRGMMRDRPATRAEAVQLMQQGI